MDSIKNYVAGLLAVAALFLGGFAYFKSAPEPPSPPFGASSAPAFSGGCFDLSGYNLCIQRQPMSLASTTCSTRVTASSTLLYAGVNVTTVDGGGYDLEFGKSSFIDATSTVLGTQTSLASNSSVIASSTGNGGNAVAQTLSPGQYFNVKIGSSTPTALKGSCVEMFLTF